ncbi:hypothetical protein CLCR_04435 [Cladophialophora carrionii]|uniref:Uncharacterized protein n=1 Tax=Cladophialophora carrionii TaxID=86049 RepID=A0A1C1CIX1_9EURO|nr:hypothetical protein CLCR_04435 [Cladophialophora carrionii]
MGRWVDGECVAEGRVTKVVENYGTNKGNDRIEIHNRYDENSNRRRKKGVSVSHPDDGSRDSESTTVNEQRASATFPGANRLWFGVFLKLVLPLAELAKTATNWV